MANNEPMKLPRLPGGWTLAPIHPLENSSPLAICVLARTDASAPFFLLRDLPLARVYLGAICDAEARIHEWVEICIQSSPSTELEFSGYQAQLSNVFFDQGWRAESELIKQNLPQTFIAVRLESHNAGPLLIRQPAAASPGLASVEPTPWRVCTEDAVLEAHGLPPYSSSPFRYLHEPAVRENKTFIATSADAPASSHVQNLERLTASANVMAVFNPHAGMIRVIRHAPLNLEEYLQILEGEAWAAPAYNSGPYAALQEWSANPKGLPFLLHGDGARSDHANEVLFLKLAALRDAFAEVRLRVKAQQLPLLNLSPASFQISLPETGGQFPGFWSASCRLAKPGQAHPLKIKSTEQRYFLRLGRVEPSPFLPEGMGAHSFGIGNVQIRTVTTETDGVVLEGTLVAEDYLAIDPHDLLWFKLPLGEERHDFYAHVYKSDTVGPREARFRTVPARLAEPVVASLKRTAGTRFPKSPYEIWPLLSSPCDLYSLGVLGVRILLANGQSNLPVILDEIFSLARRFAGPAKDRAAQVEELKALITKDAKLLDLISPQALIAGFKSPLEARTAISWDLWLETVSWLLQLFPDASAHSFCKDFGDVSPLALETVFDEPLQQLETILLRLRSLLAPSLSQNQEIANVILEQME